jgi:hypothetical protein
MADTESISLIEAKFPRVVQTVTLLWWERELRNYFEKLIVDERGDRDGFPPDVMQELLFLARLHREVVPTPPDDPSIPVYKFK